MKKIHSPDIKIITIEDPIEYHLPGIVQTQVNSEKNTPFKRIKVCPAPRPGHYYDWRNPRRRNSRDCDKLGSHRTSRVLNSSHQHRGWRFPRLMDLNINPKVISSAINITIAQRLIRKLCSQCKKERPIEETEKKIFDKILESVSDKSYLENLQRNVVWQPVGCDKCNKTGYKGRVGIFEAILIDESVENIIQENPSEREIKKPLPIKECLI